MNDIYTEVFLVSDLIEKGFDQQNHRSYTVYAHLSPEVREWCQTHIGPIEAKSYRHIGYEGDVMFETYEHILNTDLIRITFASFADFLAFKMRWL